MARVGKQHRFLPAIIALSLSIWLNPLGAQEHSLRAVYNAISGVMAPIWVAADAGLFTKHGVNVDVKYLAATSAVQAMLGGGEEVGFVGNQGIDAKLEGADLVYIASGLPTFVFQLYSRPEIKTIADLKGKVIAVTQPAASTDYATRMVLRKNGLDPEKDVKILYAQDSINVINTVITGNAAAGINSHPNALKLKAAGMKMLVDITELKIPFLFTGILSSPKSCARRTTR